MTPTSARHRDSEPGRVLLVEGSGRGFLSHYSHALALGLHRGGAEVTLATGRRDELAGWPVPFAKMACLGPGLRGWRCALRLVRALRPRVVHLQWVDHPLFALAFVRWAQRLGARVVYTPHNILPHERRWLLMPLYRLLYRRVDRVVARDRQLAWALEELLDTPQARLVYVPGSPNFLAHLPLFSAPSAAPVPERDDELRLLFFGHGSGRKGLAGLLATLAARKAWPDSLHLMVAGEDVVRGIDPALLERLRGRLRLTVLDRYIPPAEVAGLFRGADLLLLPYVKRCKSPLPDLAAALGLPVLRSDRVEAAGFREGVNGLTFPHDRPGRLAAVLGDLLAAPERLRRMRRTLAAQWYPEVATDDLARRHLRLYRDVLQIGAGRPERAAPGLPGEEVP